jgi:hypothetical protein
MASALLRQMRLEQRLPRIAEPSAGTHRHAGRTAPRLQPSFMPTSITLADLYRQQGLEHKVMQTLRKALQVDPRVGAVFHTLGRSLLG